MNHLEKTQSIEGIVCSKEYQSLVNDIKKRAIEEGRKFSVSKYTTEELYKKTIESFPSDWNAEMSQQLIRSKYQKLIAHGDFCSGTIESENIEGEVNCGSGSGGSVSYGGVSWGAPGDGYGICEDSSDEYTDWDDEVMDLGKAKVGDWISWTDLSGYNRDIDIDMDGFEKNQEVRRQASECVFLKIGEDSWKVHELI